MKISDDLFKTEQGYTQAYYDGSSFNLVSNLLTEALERNCQQVLITAKAGNFHHDPAAEVASTETTHFSICNSDINVQKGVTEIFIEGTLRRRDRSGSSFSIFFVLQRDLSLIPGSFTTMGSAAPDDRRVRKIAINGMLYNSIFSLNLKCINTNGKYSPHGEGRGYLIFEQIQ